MKIYVILRNFSYIEGVKINFSKFLEIKNKNYKNFEKYHKIFEKYEKIWKNKLKIRIYFWNFSKIENSKKIMTIWINL